MTYTSDHHHGRREIRSSGVEPCDGDNHETALEALRAIKQLRELPSRRWVTAHCCRCGMWHITSVPREAFGG